MYNPRWPFTFVIVQEALDENGLPVTNEEGDPVETAMAVERCVYDSGWNPIRYSDGSFRTELITEIPWGYRTATGGLKTSGDVIVADYKISCPKLLTDIPTGTVLLLTDDVHTFRVVVLKMTTYNWGTDLWVDNVKN